MLINTKTHHFIDLHANDDVHQLALKTPPPDVDLPLALDQINGLQIARKKLPLWAATEGIVYPPHLSMEQCSSEATARYKQSIVRHLIRECSSEKPYEKENFQERKLPDCPISSKVITTNMVDLTGGLGSDFFYIAPLFDHAIYVERQKLLCELAEHNFPLLGLSRAEIINTDGIKFLQSADGPFDLIYADPARRNSHGERTYALSDCTPDVLPFIPMMLAKARFVMLKLSPMLDITQTVRSLNAAAGYTVMSHIHIVAVNNECKELLAVLQADGVEEPKIYCVNCTPAAKDSASTGTRSTADGVTAAFSCTWQEATVPPPLTCDTPHPGMMLFEPSAAVMKAGCFGPLAKAFSIQAISREAHLFVAGVDHPDFPGRRMIIRRVSSMNKKSLRDFLSGVVRANITVRHFPLSADQLRKRLKLRDGGDDYLFATTTSDGHHILLLCKKHQPL